MNPHITATIAGALAAVLTVAVAQLIRPTPPPQVSIVRLSGAFADNVTDAKARLIAATTWPEMEQREIDALTATAKEIGGTVTIFCHEETKCGDLALNLDNAFESARWVSSVQMATGLPDGIAASTKELAALLNAATGGRYDVGVDEHRSAPGDYIAIGRRKRVP